MSTATLQAVSLAVDLLTAATELATRLQHVNALLQKAHTEGRDITEEELKSCVKMDDDAKLKLDVAIAKALAGA